MFNRKIAVSTDSEQIKKQLDAFRKISSLLISGSPLEISLKEITAFIPQILGVTMVSILLWDKNKKQFILKKVSLPKSVITIAEFATRSKVEGFIYPGIDSDNIFVKTVRTKEVQYSRNLQSILEPMMNEKYAKKLIKIVQIKVKMLISAPMIVKGEVLGVIVLGWEQEKFLEEDKIVINTFANQAAIAIYNSRLYEQVQEQVSNVEKRNNQLESINKFTNKIITTLEQDQIAQNALDTIPETLGYLGAAYASVNTEQNIMKIVGITNNKYSKIAMKLIGKDISHYQIKLDDPRIKDNLNIRAYTENKIIIARHFSELAGNVVSKSVNELIQRNLNIKTIVAVPIRSQNKVIGILDFIIQTKFPDELLQTDMDMMSIISNQIGIAFDNAKLYGKVNSQVLDLEARNKQLHRINNFTDQIITTLDADILTKSALRNIADMLGNAVATYFYLDNENQVLRVANVSDNAIAKLGIRLLPKRLSNYSINLNDPNLQENIIVRAAKEYKILKSNNFNSYVKGILPRPIISSIKNILRFKGIIVIPVTSKNQIVGIMSFLLQNKNYEEISQVEIDTLSILSNQFRIAVENANLYSQMKNALDEVKKAYERDKDMIDILGHELRTPATVCKGNIELAMKYVNDKISSSEDKHFLSSKLTAAFNAIKKETSLINGLLTATKLDSGQLIIANEIINLYHMSRTTFQNYLEFAHDQNLELKFINPKRPIPKTIGDSVRLGEVLDNLVSNAIKYTKAGKIEISLENNSSMIYVHVKDTGNGIPPDKKDSLFQKFSRLHNHINESSNLVRPGGTGLGLYVCKGIVEAHGGEIWVESEGEGQGSTFSFSLPIKNLNRNTKETNEDNDMFRKLGMKNNL